MTSDKEAIHTEQDNNIQPLSSSLFGTISPRSNITSEPPIDFFPQEGSSTGIYERLQPIRVPLRRPQPFNPTPVQFLRQSNPDGTREALTAEQALGAHMDEAGSLLNPDPLLCSGVDVSIIEDQLDGDERFSQPLFFETAAGATASSLPSRDRDPLRLSRFLAFPTEVGHHGAEVHLFDGLMNQNMHEIRLLRAGYYAIRLRNFNESAWDSLYLGIGKMKAVVEFEVFPPPLELQRRTKKHAATGRENPSSPSNCEIGHQGQPDSCYYAKSPMPEPMIDLSSSDSRARQTMSEDSRVEKIGLDLTSAATSYSADFRPPSSNDLQVGFRGSEPQQALSVNDENGNNRIIDGDTLERHSLLSVRVAAIYERETNPNDGAKVSDSPPYYSGNNDMPNSPGVYRDKESEMETDDPSEQTGSLPKDVTTESISVISERGELICKAQQEKVVYFYVPESQSSLKLQVYASLTLGMRLRCSYDLLYCGLPKVSPSNPLVPFLRNANILCLDGGGVLGISSLKILERLELEIQKELRDPTVRITDCFDMVCGTSTGGIISLGLLTGLSIKDMISMWGTISGKIFEGNRSLFSGIVFEGYDVTRLKTTLVHGLGNRYMNSYTQPYCFVTSTNVKHNPYELFLLRNYTHSNLAKHEFRGGSAIPVWAAAWATAAAPTYLKGPNSEELEKMGLIIRPEVQLCDGAMKANNPTMVALEEAARLSGKKLQHFIESDLDCCLSIGTGQPTLRQTIEKTGIVSTFQILVNAAHLLTSSTNVHRDVLHWLGDHEEKYFRFNTPGIGDIPLDAVEKSSYDLIVKATNDYLSDEKYYDIKRLVKKLSYHVR